MSTDFKTLSNYLLDHAQSLLHEWFPLGRVQGKEFTVGNLRGDKGTSLSINIKTGAWADFATGDKGGDLISLYAAIYGFNQGQAASELTTKYAPHLLPAPKFTKPQRGSAVPPMKHWTYGKPSEAWSYHDADGGVMFYIARYDTPDGKEFLPWSWDGTAWKSKSWPAPRPLYGLQDLAENPEAGVIIVEGEKACEALRDIVGQEYIVTTWPGGANAASQVNWQPVYGRHVLIWPDADEAGVSAANYIAGVIHKHCPEVKVIDVAGVEPEGYDAADAVADGWSWTAIIDWAKPRTNIYSETATTPVVITNNTLNVTEDALDIPMPAHVLQVWQSLGVQPNRQNTITANIANINTALEGLPAFKNFAWFDEFYLKYRTTWSGNCVQSPVRDWSEVDDLNLTHHFQHNLGMTRASIEMSNQAMRLFAHKRIRNEPKDWLESLKWDGKFRICKFFSEYLGAKHNQYTFDAAKNFWVGIVARIMKPGCQLDTMVVLYGGQGVYKTTTARIIGGQWYANMKSRVTDKDFMQALQGKILIEIAELDSFKNADMSAIKNMITSESDYFRMPYARLFQDFPRRCVFIGTTNDPQFLRDETGGRRFIPIEVGKILPDKIKADRDQLFAEAVHFLKAGEDWWSMPTEATEETQERHRQGDDWESVVADHVAGQDRITSLEVAKKAIGLDIKDIDWHVSRRIGRIMTRLGFINKPVREGDKLVKMWERSDVTSVTTHYKNEVTENHE